jgi:hypothetical protein
MRVDIGASLRAQSVSVVVPSARLLGPTSLFVDNTGVYATSNTSGVVRFTLDLISFTTILTVTQCPNAGGVHKDSNTLMVFVYCTITTSSLSTDTSVWSIASNGIVKGIATFGSCNPTAIVADANKTLVYIGRERGRKSRGVCRERELRVDADHIALLNTSSA